MELPDPVRQRLGNFSRAVFSDSNRTGPEYSEGPDLKWRCRLQPALRSASQRLGGGAGSGEELRRGRPMGR
ncbi:hypothetical protein P7K49_029075 [Saguinus oedipus]|uniref:Uncharacterized protein n=1 Tax=Saguinus oedipus TaxID=9490 RepID=A0ABQ9U664_SAGOE|nr:hypothetical protein P7K49_029075 [Saguinus oedipus]